VKGYALTAVAFPGAGRGIRAFAFFTGSIAGHSDFLDDRFIDGEYTPTSFSTQIKKPLFCALRPMLLYFALWNRAY
jgi:hypothetical protein